MRHKGAHEGSSLATKCIKTLSGDIYMKKSLHRLIPDKELPFPLRQPLVFGNRDQINAFSALESDIELMETRQAKIAAGGLRHFDVRIEYTGTQNFRVLAIDKCRGCICCL